MTVTKKYVTYYRVSSKDEKRQINGIPAQQRQVGFYLQAYPGEVIAEFCERESGRKCKRPKLLEAVALCRQTGATLLIAKVDRLARNMAFVSNLMDSDVNFVCADNPSATRLTIHIYAAVAEAEALAISQRTKAGLAEVKARGKLLGASNPKWQLKMKDRKIWEKNFAEAGVMRASQVKAYYRNFLPYIVELRKTMTFDQMIQKLNEEGYTTSTGGPWTRGTLHRVLARSTHTKPGCRPRLSETTKQALVNLRKAGLKLRQIAGILNQQGETTPAGLPWTSAAVCKTIKRLETTDGNGNGKEIANAS